MEVYYFTLKFYKKIKKLIKKTKDHWFGEEFSVVNIKLNQYLIAKKRLGHTITPEDLSIDPIGKDKELYEETLKKADNLEGVSCDYINHLSHKLDMPFLQKTEYPARVAKDLVHSVSIRNTLTPSQLDILIEGQFLFAIKHFYNLLWYKVWKKVWLHEDADVPVSINDFIHDNNNTGFYTNNSNNSYKLHSSINDEFLMNKWSSYKSIASDKFMVTNTEIYPLNALDNYHSVYNYFLYKNAGINYLKYANKNKDLSLLEKMLCYSSVSNYHNYTINSFSFEWKLKKLVLFSLDYNNTFINPFYNFITDKSYSRMRHNRADPLSFAASLYRSSRRGNHHKGFMVNRPRIREVLYQKNLKHLLDLGKSELNIKPKYKRARTSSLHHAVVTKRAQTTRSAQNPVDHLPTKLEHKHPIFYDTLQYYISTGKLSHLDRISFTGLPNKYLNNVPNISHSARLGNRLARKLYYVNSKIESDNNSVYVSYINYLQKYLNNYKPTTKLSFDSLSTLYDNLLVELNTRQVNSILDSYYFRKHYLSDLYHRFNFTDLTSRTHSNLLRKNIINRGRYSMNLGPGYLENQYTTLKVRMNNYDIHTLTKLELLSSLKAPLYNITKLASKLNPQHVDLFSNNIGTLQLTDLLVLITTPLSLLGFLLFDVYMNIDVTLINLFSGDILYPWMNPIIKNLESFWYSYHYFYLDFDNLNALFGDTNIRYNLNIDKHVFNLEYSSYDQIKDNLGKFIDINHSFVNPYVYGHNSFFNSQYQYYIYQSKNVLKLPYYPLENSSIVYFQWDNFPLLNLTSHGDNTNLIRLVENFTYNLFSYDLSHMMLLLLKDITFNLSYFDYNVLSYIWLSLLQMASYGYFLVHIIISFFLSTKTFWFIPFVIKYSFINGLTLYGSMLNNVTFLNIKHLIIDLPYWYVIDTITSLLFHWNHWVLGLSTYFTGSNWVPFWYIYTFMDNYLKTYFIDYYYYYYSSIGNSNNSLYYTYLGFISLALYWILLLPIYYIIKFIFISLFVEFYGILLFILLAIYYYLIFFNTSKKYSWLYKDLNKYTIRSWNLKYQAHHDQYINSFVPYTQQLHPYIHRSYSSSYDVMAVGMNKVREHHNSLKIWRNLEISGYRKYPGWHKNYYNYPNISEYLFNLGNSNKVNSNLHTIKDFYEQMMFSKEYIDFKQKSSYGFNKMPLFRSYPKQVQDYYRKSIYSFGMLGRHKLLFKSNLDYIIPMILLGKHFEDQNFNVSLKATTSNIVDELTKSSPIHKDLISLRYYYLRKYFPVYARFYHSNNRTKNISKRYKKGKHPSQYEVNQKYILWDGSSHSIYLLPGVSSLSDEQVLDQFYHDPAVYNRNLVKYLNNESFSYEDWITDGTLPEGISNLNLGLQHSEKILSSAFNLISVVERQRRIVYTLFCYTPGFKRFYTDYVFRRYRFKFRKVIKDEEVHLSDYDTNKIDALHEYYTKKNHFKLSPTESNMMPNYKPITTYKWTGYKTNLLWYLSEIRKNKTEHLKDWRSSYDLGALLVNHSIEYSIISSNYLYPLFYYNTLGDTYQFTFAWHKLSKIHNLDKRHRKGRALSWELSTSWQHDMSLVDNSDIMDNPHKHSYSTTLSEVFDDTINGKLIPSLMADNYSYHRMLLSKGRGLAKYSAKVFYREALKEQIMMGKYYRYLHYKHSVQMQAVVEEAGRPFKLDFKEHPQNYYKNIHLLGLTGRNDYLLEQLSYDFDTGWVKFFNFIGYKKYKDQRAGMDNDSRKLSVQSARTLYVEHRIKALHELDYFGNANIYNTFLSEFQDLTTSIYYSWLSQQSFKSPTKDQSDSYDLSLSSKNKYLLGNYFLSQNYGYSRYSQIKDVLRDTHNYIKYSEESYNYPFSLKTIENFYEYDRYTDSPYVLDSRWDNRLVEGVLQSKKKRPHKMFKHFRYKGPKLFGSSKEQIYKLGKKSYKRSAPLIDVVGKSPGDLVMKEHSQRDLLHSRSFKEVSDHVQNLLDLNLELFQLEVRPVLFYKMPVSQHWMEYEQDLHYYNWYNNELLNSLKQQHIDNDNGSWKYHYLKDLLRTTEYDHIFEHTLKYKYDSTFDYNLLERYCNQDITGALLTKRYFIYKEKIKSISPSASVFFEGFYPEYIWEYYEFNWYEEIKNDWFLMIPLFGLFFIYYMGIPNDYYKFSRKRFKRTMYVHHINRRRKSGPKNAQRRIFQIPNRLKRRRLQFYKVQSKNNIIFSKVTNLRNNLRSKEYLYPYRYLNPLKYEYTSHSNLKNRSRHLRNRRIVSPRKFIFYDGYTIQLRMNRRRSRRNFRRRLHGLRKNTLFSNMKLMRGVDPYYSYKLKNEELDSYVKLWKKRRNPKGTRRYGRLSNAYSRPYRKPYRRFYPIDFYQNLLYNDLLKLCMLIKSFFMLLFGTLKILVLHFTKHPISWTNFKYTLKHIWTYKFELFPSLRYLYLKMNSIIIPRIVHTMAVITSNTNPYNKPFGLGNKKKIRRYWRGKRRNYRDRLSIYSAIYALSFDYIILPLYRNIIKPFYNVIQYTISLEKQFISYTDQSFYNIGMKLTILKHLLTVPVLFHANAYYSKFISILYYVFSILIKTLYILCSIIMYPIFIIIKPLLVLFFYSMFKLYFIIVKLIKPLVTVVSSSSSLIKLFISTIKFITLQCSYFFFISTKLVYILILGFARLLYFSIVMPVYICLSYIYTSKYTLLSTFISFYTTQTGILLKLIKQYIIKLYCSNRITAIILTVFKPLIYLYYRLMYPFFYKIFIIVCIAISKLFNILVYFIILYLEPCIYYFSKYSVTLYTLVNTLIHKCNTILMYVITYIKSYFTLQYVATILYSYVLSIINTFWLFIHTVLKLFWNFVSKFIISFISSYTYVYLSILFLFLFLNSIIINFTILFIYLSLFIKIVVSYILYIMPSLLLFTAYSTYFLFTPIIYIALVLFKLLFILPVIIIKLFILNFICIIYFVFNFYHIYLEYLCTPSMSFSTLSKMLMQDCLIESIELLYKTTYNYLFNITKYIIKYYISNNIYDIWSFCDYYMNRASIEVYRFYKYTRK